MAYSLIFWRESHPQSESPERVYERICNDETIAGIADLPIDKIKTRFKEVFPEIEDHDAEMNWEGQGSYFDVTWPPCPTNAIIVSCGYKLLDSPDTMNQIIDLALEFGCALYDPQVGKRFDEPG